MAESWKKLDKGKYAVSDFVITRTVSDEHLLLEIDTLQTHIDNLKLELAQKVADLDKIKELEKNEE